MYFVFTRNHYYEIEQGKFVIDNIEKNGAIHIRFVGGELVGTSRVVNQKFLGIQCRDFLELKYTDKIREHVAIQQFIKIHILDGNKAELQAAIESLAASETFFEAIEKPAWTPAQVNTIVRGNLRQIVKRLLNAASQRMMDDFTTDLITFINVKMLEKSLECTSSFRENIYFDKEALNTFSQQLLSKAYRTSFDRAIQEAKEIVKRDVLDIESVKQISGGFQQFLMTLVQIKQKYYININFPDNEIQDSIRNIQTTTINRRVYYALLNYYQAHMKNDTTSLKRLIEEIVALKILFRKITTNTEIISESTLARFREEILQEAMSHERKRLKSDLPSIMRSIRAFSRKLTDAIYNLAPIQEILTLEELLVEKRVDFCIVLSPKSLEEIVKLREMYTQNVKYEFGVTSSEIARVCWVCLSKVSRDVNDVCYTCKWWVCTCGACKCPDFWNGRKRIGIECHEQKKRFGEVAYKLLLKRNDRQDWDDWDDSDDSQEFISDEGPQP